MFTTDRESLGLVEDDSEAKKEAAEWERRRARVTAALVPGLKKNLGGYLEE